MEKLIEVRKELSLTQVQAAELIGVSRRTYQSVEERKRRNAKVDSYIAQLKERFKEGNKSLILSTRYIKKVSSEIFAKYKEVRCAYLFGSYARREATAKSDVDILIVSETMGLSFYGLAAELEEKLGKSVDLLTHRQLNDNAEFLAKFLKEGVKIYGQNANQVTP